MLPFCPSVLTAVLIALFADVVKQICPLLDGGFVVFRQSNLEDILFDDDKWLMLMIVAKELQDKKTRRNGQDRRSAGFASLRTARLGIACSCKITSPRYQPIMPMSSIIDIECGVCSL
jgi:hypothetical protein